jgi:hypothetical protein
VPYYLEAHYAGRGVIKLKASVDVIDEAADPESRPLWEGKVEFAADGACVVVTTASGSVKQPVLSTEDVVTIRLIGLVPAEEEPPPEGGARKSK